MRWLRHGIAHVLCGIYQKVSRSKTSLTYVGDLLDVEDAHSFTVVSNNPFEAHNCIQLTGHIYCMVWLMFLEQEMDALNIEWYPIVEDFHDETIKRCRIMPGSTREQTIEKVSAAMIRACASANKALCLLGDEIPMAVEPDSGTNLAKFKIENYGKEKA